MPHFLIIAIDHEPHSMPLRNEKRSDHRRYVLENDSAIRLAGALTDDQGNQCGSLYSFEAESADAVRAWLEAEPFFRSGVYATVRVVEWNPALNRLPSLEWRRR
jgi:uncharacterized protein YciI